MVASFGLRLMSNQFPYLVDLFERDSVAWCLMCFSAYIPFLSRTCVYEGQNTACLYIRLYIPLRRIYNDNEYLDRMNIKKKESMRQSPSHIRI
jgi:hypothetical protein